MSDVQLDPLRLYQALKGLRELRALKGKPFADAIGSSVSIVRRWSRGEGRWIRDETWTFIDKKYGSNPAVRAALDGETGPGTNADAADTHEQNTDEADRNGAILAGRSRQGAEDMDDLNADIAAIVALAKRVNPKKVNSVLKFISSILDDDDDAQNDSPAKHGRDLRPSGVKSGAG